jgi:hypothetical protein
MKSTHEGRKEVVRPIVTHFNDTVDTHPLGHLAGCTAQGPLGQVQLRHSAVHCQHLVLGRLGGAAGQAPKPHLDVRELAGSGGSRLACAWQGGWGGGEVRTEV